MRNTVLALQKLPTATGALALNSSDSCMCTGGGNSCGSNNCTGELQPGAF